MDGMILVPEREHPRTVAVLGMRCDAQEIPDPVDATDCQYFIGLAEATGTASQLLASGDAVGEQAAVDAAGSVAIAVTSSRVYGIVAPQSAAEPAVWFAADLGSIQAAAEGQEGMFRKRPRGVQLAGADWKVRLAEVSLLSRRSGRFQTGKADALLAALGG